MLWAGRDWRIKHKDAKWLEGASERIVQACQRTVLDAVTASASGWEDARLRFGVSRILIRSLSSGHCRVHVRVRVCNSPVLLEASCLQSCAFACKFSQVLGPASLLSSSDCAGYISFSCAGCRCPTCSHGRVYEER